MYQHIVYQYKMRFYLLYCVPHRFSLIGLLCIINGSHCVLALLCFINDNLNTISAYSIPSLPSLSSAPPSTCRIPSLPSLVLPPSILLNTYRIPSLPSLVPPSILLNTYSIPSLPSLSPPLLSFLILIEYPYYLLLSPPILPPLQNTINFENTIPPHFCISCSKQMLYSVLN